MGDAKGCRGRSQSPLPPPQRRIRSMIPEENAEAYKARIFDMSSGSVTAEARGEAFKAVPLN